MSTVETNELAQIPMTWRMRRIRDGVGPSRTKGAVTMLPISRVIQEIATQIAEKQLDADVSEYIGEAWIIAFEVVHSQAQAIYIQRNGSLIRRCQALAENRMDSFMTTDDQGDNDSLEHVVVDPSQSHETYDRERWLHSMLSSIPEREQYVISTRLGQQDQSLTLDQIASAYGVTRQAIDQMVRKWERILTRRWSIDSRYDPYAPAPVPRTR